MTLPKRNRILPAFVIVSPLPSVSPFLQSWSRSAFLCATARAHASFQCLGSFVTCATNSLHSAAAAFRDLDIVYWKARIKHYSQLPCLMTLKSYGGLFVARPTYDLRPLGRPTIKTAASSPARGQRQSRLLAKSSSTGRDAFEWQSLNRMF